jgi:hypothetical protein
MVSLSVPRATQFSVIPNGGTSRVIADRLNREWEQWREMKPTWPSAASDLEAVLHSIRFNPDCILGDLITACQNGDSLAGRCIVQALLPKLILMSSYNPYPPLDHMVAALWLRIARYSLKKRPSAIAANLVLDARKETLMECRKFLVVPADDNQGDPLSADSVIGTARDLGLASPESLTIVEKVYLEGLPSTKVARLFNMTPEAVRRRCCDTIQRLRKHRLLLAEICTE